MPILAQTSPVFQPAMRVIGLLVSIGNITRIVTTIPHQYDVGMIVRLNMPVGFTPQGLNQQVGEITDIIDPTTFYVGIDSSKLDGWTTPATFPENLQYPQVTPVGEVNSQLDDATRNVLPY